MEIQKLSEVVAHQCDIISKLQKRLESLMNMPADYHSEQIERLAAALLGAIQGYQILTNDEERLKFYQGLEISDAQIEVMNNSLSRVMDVFKKRDFPSP